MGEGEEGIDMMDSKQIKKITEEKLHFVCSISLTVLCNNEVNHTLCNALGYKLFTFLCKYVNS